MLLYYYIIVFPLKFKYDIFRLYILQLLVKTDKITNRSILKISETRREVESGLVLIN